MTKVSSAPTGDFNETESLVAWISLIEMILFSNTTKSKSKKDRMATCNNYHGLWWTNFMEIQDLGHFLDYYSSTDGLLLGLGLLLPWSIASQHMTASLCKRVLLGTVWSLLLPMKDI